MTAPFETSPDRKIPVSELAAALICLAASAGFVALAMALPAGHSRGDVGPGALPEQIGIFGMICAACYLVSVLRGGFAGKAGKFTDTPRALACFAIFAIGMAVVPWLGLALSLSIASAVLTLLFQGERHWPRAAATGIGLWLIATLLFQKLLGLPLP